MAFSKYAETRSAEEAASPLQSLDSGDGKENEKESVGNRDISPGAVRQMATCTSDTYVKSTNDQTNATVSASYLIRGIPHVVICFLPIRVSNCSIANTDTHQSGEHLDVR